MSDSELSASLDMTLNVDRPPSLDLGKLRWSPPENVPLVNHNSNDMMLRELYKELNNRSTTAIRQGEFKTTLRTK